eukprot:CAMPEP_0118725372 /NCGR_PEP_ID=MMETSP0800-20121206/33104_1 /TAXON_ID=210618 ORGANISM="Striatella unipunctata, Strain CCMP2910" /NCGR_SAMPLE_ID=MMETSP0800 /ASSEMBLY_ACC=CAM_ASM_000638 /LENGTH=207 /DNA_ID=CAMNT_0006634065 /DNA_START=136 /DNA_END=759 /DNA_ORIENTATION=-
MNLSFCLPCIESVNDGSKLCSEGSENGFFIQSVEHKGMCLACSNGGYVDTTEDSADWETWRLEPIMPETIHAHQIWNWVGLGVGTAALAVIAPFGVMGVIGAMGFGAEGIVAGSVAAGMMSAEAVAVGGGVAAGGLVATLQSVGAAGLGVAGVAAAAGTGAGVGLAAGVSVVSKGAVGTLHRSDDEGQNKTTLEPENHLPLCSWRQW